MRMILLPMIAAAAVAAYPVIAQTATPAPDDATMQSQTATPAPADENSNAAAPSAYQATPANAADAAAPEDHAAHGKPRIEQSR